MKPRVPTIYRVGDVLRAFTLSDPVWKLQDLAARLEWNDATTHRLLRALVDIGLLDYDEQAATYQIGLLPLELAAVSLESEPRRRELLRAMEAISEASGLTVQIGVLEAQSVAIVASHESRDAVRAAAMLGERLPLHASAAGKAILSLFTDDEVLAVLPAKLEAFTAHTITDHAQLLVEIAAARSHGIAQADSELSEGLYALAVPVTRRAFGSQAAAVTCAGLSRELVPAQWRSAEQALRKYARDLFIAPLPPVPLSGSSVGTSRQ
jgi:DNA-binding IclR family transcriptional regulator